MEDEYDARRGFSRRDVPHVVVSARASVAAVNENLPQGGRATPSRLALPEGG
jgi:hypothetical protein